MIQFLLSKWIIDLINKMTSEFNEGNHNRAHIIYKKMDNVHSKELESVKLYQSEIQETKILLIV